MYAIREASFAQLISHFPCKPGVACLIPGFSSPSVLRIEITNRDPVTIFKTMTYRDKAGVHVVPNLLIPMDLDLRPDLWTKIIHTHAIPSP